MDVLIKQITASFWMILAGVEFLFIIYLLLISKRKKIDSNLRAKVMNENVDFDNLINSAFHAEKLWEDLRKKCHPDCFGGDEKKILIAGEIQASINGNKTDLKLLQDLKIRAENELGVKI